MPELPEIEVLRRSLTPVCSGRTIREVEVFEPRLREPIEPGFGDRLRDRSIETLSRRAKYLLAHLSGERTLVVHLGMSGRLEWSAEASPPGKHQHWRLQLDDASVLTYRDPRRFGLAEVIASGDLVCHRRFHHLGAEPLSEEFDGAYLRRRAHGRRRGIKEFLMDQTVVVGVGNIYASEALHRARVHPRRKVSRVSLATWTRIAEAVRETLNRAIDAGGSTLNDFRNGVGDSGYFQIEHAVYDRAGQLCPRCRGRIRKIVLGNRSTYYCPRCQR